METYCVHGHQDSTHWKLSLLLKLTYKYNSIPIKNPIGLKKKKNIEKLILKCMWTGTDPRIAKINPEK